MRDIATTTLIQSRSQSALGRIPLAGFIRNSVGVSCANMRTLGSYALVLLLDGEGFYRDTRGIEATVYAGDMLLIFPDISHCYGPLPHTRWSEFYIIFEGDVFDLWRRHTLLNDLRPILHLQPAGYWLRRFEEVVSLHSSTQTQHVLQSICKLQEVLAEAIEYSPHGADENNIAWLQRARLLLERDFNRDLTQVAREMGMSYESFRKTFATLARVAPGQYRLSVLMDRACEMVHRNEMSNKEIAQRLGFCDEFHFSRQFKKVTGYSPREFRRRLPLLEETSTRED
jgi:AraC-like DNA-binding protein